MKAIRMVAVNQPLELHDLPIPVPTDHQVLVQVRAAGICHSDVSLPRRHLARLSAPPHPGARGRRQWSNRSAATSRVSKPGDRVCLHYLLTCGELRLLHHRQRAVLRQRSK